VGIRKNPSNEPKAAEGLGRHWIPRRNRMSHTVLIADDADFIRVMLREILVDMDLEVVGEASDGTEAISLYHEKKPELTLLDITMPGVDGIEALKQIIKHDPAAMVVMVTPLGQKDKVLESIKAGAKDFVVKPFDQDRVQATLTRLLERVAL
jgi:two-component system chemotaxis response regulator CheY